MTLHNRLIYLRQDSTHLHYRTFSTHGVPVEESKKFSADLSKALVIPDANKEDTKNLLKHYLNLRPNLTALYEYWSSVDPNFRKRAPKFTGVRILKQDPWEALVGFICSSNNNIARISQMVNNLCIHYGPLIGLVDGQPVHDFPTPDALSGPGVEANLRQLGFGYRAGYIARTAVIVAKERPQGWLESLCNPEVYDDSLDQKDLPPGGREGYRKAHEALLELVGVGPKVADCVCLMGLGWGESVPVDTHVWQFAQRDYNFGKGKHKSLTKATYDAVGDHFRNLWGREAGWAHSVLFAADLKTFSERLTTKVEVKVDEKVVKQEGKATLQENVLNKNENLAGEVKVKIEPKPEVKIKQEEGTTLEEETPLKRKYSSQDVEVEGEEEKDTVKVESSRSERAKRRKW